MKRFWVQKWVIDTHQVFNLSFDHAGNFAILHNLVLRSIILHLMDRLSNVIHREVWRDFGHGVTPHIIHLVIHPRDNPPVGCILLVPRVDKKNKNKNNTNGKDIVSTSSCLKSSIFIYFRISFLKIQSLTVMSRPVPSRPKLARIMGIQGAF